MGKDALTADTHVIVVPPGLMDQWTLELHRYLQHGSFCVLPYTGNCTVQNRTPFWQEYDARKGTSPIIIVASSTVRPYVIE